MLWLALVLACSPASPQTRSFAGPHGFKLEQVAGGGRRFAPVALQLIGADGKPRWKLPQVERGVFAPVFSEDGSWVADALTLHESKVRVFSPAGALNLFDALELVTEEEQQNMSRTSCGLAWLRGMEFHGKTLVVSVNQAPMRPPIYAPDPTPPLELLIDLDTMKLSRRAPPQRSETIDELVALWKREPARRDDVLRKLVAKAALPSSRGNSALPQLARAELAGSADPKHQAGLLAIIERLGSSDDHEWVAAQALAAKWPVDVSVRIAARVRNAPAAAEYARAVVRERLGGVNERSEALRIALASHPPDAIALVKSALDDPEPYVREAAGHQLNELPRTAATFDFLALRVELPAAGRALVQVFLKLPLDELTARFERECETWRTAWPGCDAWSGALADVRGDVKTAAARYGRAVEALTPKVTGDPGAAFEARRDLFRLHVRLARLALAQKRRAEAKAHADAIDKVKWAENERVECSTGLPRALEPKCDGGLAREYLIAELNGRRWR